MRPHGVLELKNAFVKSAYCVTTVCAASRLYVNLQAIFTERQTDGQTNVGAYVT